MVLHNYEKIKRVVTNPMVYVIGGGARRPSNKNTSGYRLALAVESAVKNQIYRFRCGVFKHEIRRFRSVIRTSSVDIRVNNINVYYFFFFFIPLKYAKNNGIHICT